MERYKKGADAVTSTPTRKNTDSYQINSIKFNRVCLAILIISLIAFLWAYHSKAENALYLWGGVLITASIIHAAMYPIEDEEEDE